MYTRSEVFNGQHGRCIITDFFLIIIDKTVYRTRADVTISRVVRSMIFYDKFKVLLKMSSISSKDIIDFYAFYLDLNSSV